MIAFIINTAPEDNKFVSRIWEWTINKLYFQNGYYDFVSGNFEPNDGNTFHSVEYDLSMVTRPDIRQQIYERVLDPIFTMRTDPITLREQNYGITLCIISLERRLVA